MSEPYWTIEELQALPIPRCSPEDIAFEGLSEAENVAYVGRFQVPRAARGGKGLACAGCGELLCGAGILDGLLATFEWGIAWGEGRCGRCGYPTRLYHQIGDKIVSFPLQYHPEELIAVNRTHAR